MSTSSGPTGLNYSYVTKQDNFFLIPSILLDSATLTPIVEIAVSYYRDILIIKGLSPGRSHPYGASSATFTEITRTETIAFCITKLRAVQ